jgi:hypothetical protein
VCWLQTGQAGIWLVMPKCGELGSTHIPVSAMQAATTPSRHSLVPHCTQVFCAPAAGMDARKGGDVVPPNTAASCSGAGAT